MPDDRQLEMLSAFLDGALPAEEGREVERWLAESPELRACLAAWSEQRVALRALPRLRAPRDLSVRVVRELNAAARSTSPPSVPASRPATSRGRRLAWWSAAIATGILLALVVWTGVGPREIAHQEPDAPGAVGPTRTGGDPARPTGSQNTASQELSGAELAAAVGEFQKLVRLILVYDITLSASAQQNRVLETWLAQVGIPVAQALPVNERLERKLMESRFLASTKAATAVAPAPVPAEISLLFVRGSVQQIDGVYQQYMTVRNQPEVGVQIKLDLASTPGEMELFFQLNHAAGTELAAMRIDPSVLKTPGAFPLVLPKSWQGVATPFHGPEVAASDHDSRQRTGRRSAFRLASHRADSLAMGNAGAWAPVAGGAVGQVPEGNVAADGNAACQALFVVRRLKEPPAAAN